MKIKKQLILAGLMIATGMQLEVSADAIRCKSNNANKVNAANIAFIDADSIDDAKTAIATQEGWNKNNIKYLDCTSATQSQIAAYTRNMGQAPGKDVQWIGAKTNGI